MILASVAVAEWPPGRSGALLAALRQIEAQFGKGSVVQLGKNFRIDGEGVIPSGSLTLDRALGIGGFPRG
jgi:recombination protein RecA